MPIIPKLAVIACCLIPIGAGAEPAMPAHEVHSTNLRPFHKWTAMLRRWEWQRQVEAEPAEWAALKRRLAGMEPRAIVERVHEVINRRPYVPAAWNWGDPHFWETPYEFLANNGQCQDYAIAKFMLLRELGFDNEQLRIVVVGYPRQWVAHAVLLVVVEDETLVLDSLEDRVLPASRVGHYKPYYSINEAGWWSHFNAQRLDG